MNFKNDGYSLLLACLLACFIRDALLPKARCRTILHSARLTKDHAGSFVADVKMADDATHCMAGHGKSMVAPMQDYSSVMH